MATLKQVLVSKFKSAWQNLNLPRFKGSFLHCCRYWDKRKCIEINIEALNFSVILLGKFLHLRLKSCLMMNLAKLKVDLENRSFFLVSLISQVSKFKNGQNAKISIFSWSYTFLCMTSGHFIILNYLKKSRCFW